VTVLFGKEIPAVNWRWWRW